MLLLLSYYIFERDFFSPTFLLCTGYLISFLLTAYGMSEWGVYLGLMTMSIFLTGIISFFAGEGFIRQAVRKRKIPDELPVINEIKIGKLKYILCTAACAAVLYLTYREVLRIANLNFAEWGNLTYNYKINVVNSDLDDSSVSTLVQQANKVTKGCAYVFMYIFINNLFALKKHSNMKKLKNCTNLVPCVLFVAQTLLKGGRYPVISLIMGGVFLYYYFWKKTVGRHSDVPFKTIVKIILAAFGIVFVFWASRELVGRMASDTDILGYVTKYLGGGAVLFELLLRDASMVHDAYHETFAGLVTSFNKLGITNILIRSSHEFRSANGVYIGNAYSAIRNYFHDFGIMGVVVMDFLLASIFGSVYYKLKRRPLVKKNKSFLLILYASLIYVIFFQFFTDYFFARLSVGYFIEVFIMWLIYFFVLKTRLRFRKSTGRKLRRNR
ncbi:MAG: oligosaccharide repeat unit polymerase [Clostridiales bacterium]|nr:oligosaccharide repeat unit polymerase [Clostridiales bacterium]